MTRIRKLGKPAIVICSQPFLTLAKSQARVNGVADLSFVVIDHPLGGMDEAVVHQRVGQAAPQALALLKGFFQ